jgi:hypothetical protein
VFVIDSETTENTEDLLKHVRRVVGYVARENCIAPRSGPLGFQRCLFYQDDQGRLFNLVLSKHTIGPASTWLQYLDSFSGSQAMMALTVLCRSFPCIANGTPAPSILLRLFLRCLPYQPIFLFLNSCRGPELSSGLLIVYSRFGLDRRDQLVVVKCQHDDTCDAFCISPFPLFIVGL